MDNLTLDELCDEANERLGEAAVADGRTNPRVTPRIVRYYQSLALLSPVGREGGRAAYTPAHVEEVVAIKQAQANGLSLKEIADRLAARGRPGRVRALEPATEVDSAADRGVDVRARALVVDRGPDVAFAALRSESTRPGDQSTHRARHQHDAVGGWASAIGGVVSGWSIDLPGGLRLSGVGEPPTRQVIDRIAAVLQATEPAGPGESGK